MNRVWLAAALCVACNSPSEPMRGENELPCNDCTRMPRIGGNGNECFDSCNWCVCDEENYIVGGCTMRACGLPSEESRRPASVCGDVCEPTDEVPPAAYAGEGACLTRCGWCICTDGGPNGCESTGAFCYGRALR